MHYKVNTVLEASDYEFSELHSLAAEQFVICCQWTSTARSLYVSFTPTPHALSPKRLLRTR